MSAHNMGQDLIERVARALFDREMAPFVALGTAACDWEGCKAEFPETYERHFAEARTAIAALDRPATVEGEVIQADRELFITLMGFDAVENEADFARIRNGEFDHWRKMKLIAAHRLAHSAPKDVPEGYKLVPVEPTEEMIEAGMRWKDEALDDQWGAMLSAVPSPLSNPD